MDSAEQSRAQKLAAIRAKMPAKVQPRKAVGEMSDEELDARVDELIAELEAIDALPEGKPRDVSRVEREARAWAAWAL